MIYILGLVFFVLGLIIGSFLNVVIYRLNTNKTLGGRSACMSCNKKLSWYDLVPLFSFLFLKGKCRYCKSKISYQYPLVEFISGFVFFCVFYKLINIYFIFNLGFIVSFLYYVFLFSVFLVIVVYDLKHKIIPDVLSFIFGLVAFVGMFLFSQNYILNIFSPHLPNISDILYPLLIPLPFVLLWIVSFGKWIGLGDAKLAFGIGYLLGLGMALSALALAFWIGAVVGLGLVMFGRHYGMKSEIPFAVYLFLGTFLAFIFELHIFGI